MKTGPIVATVAIVGVAGVALVLFMNRSQGQAVPSAAGAGFVDSRKPSKGELAVQGISALSGAISGLAGAIKSDAAQDSPQKSYADIRYV